MNFNEYQRGAFIGAVMCGLLPMLAGTLLILPIQTLWIRYIVGGANIFVGILATIILKHDIEEEEKKKSNRTNEDR